MRMGSINAIVSSCGTATTSLTGRDMQAPPPHVDGKQPLFRLPLYAWKVGNRGGWKFTPAVLQIPLRFPDLQGSEIQRQHGGTRERSQDAGLARTQRVAANIS